PGTVTYSYLVRNTGNVTVTGIELEDDNAATVTCPHTSLAPGDEMTCNATHAFTQAELDAGGSPTDGSGVLANTATAASNQAPDAHDSLSIPIQQARALALRKTGLPATYDHVGQVVAYSYRVENTGNVTLPGPVTVSDDKLSVSCPDGDLAPGAVRT